MTATKPDGTFTLKQGNVIVSTLLSSLRQDHLDLSFWSLLTLLHNGIEKVERHLCGNFIKFSKEKLVKCATEVARLHTVSLRRKMKSPRKNSAQSSVIDTEESRHSQRRTNLCLLHSYDCQREYVHNQKKRDDRISSRRGKGSGWLSAKVHRVALKKRKKVVLKRIYRIFGCSFSIKLVRIVRFISNIRKSGQSRSCRCTCCSVRAPHAANLHAHAWGRRARAVA